MIAFSKHGIVGRGILLDYHSWRVKHGIQHDPFKTGQITLEHLKTVAKEQGTQIKFGDILIIRSGYLLAFAQLSVEEKQTLTRVQPPSFTGVEQTEEVLQWVWENFSCVSGDQPTFECWRTLRLRIYCEDSTNW